jgi:hypothetical protein
MLSGIPKKIDILSFFPVLLITVYVLHLVICITKPTFLVIHSNTIQPRYQRKKFSTEKKYLPINLKSNLWAFTVSKFAKQTNPLTLVRQKAPKISAQNRPWIENFKN